MRKGPNTRLRLKISLLIIPLVSLVVVASGVISSLESQRNLIESANRHMAYKAEQLRDYIYSEWGVLERLNLVGQERFRAAAEMSFESYARSLLRSESEQIHVFGPDGTLLRRAALTPSHTIIDESDRSRLTVPLKPGWFAGTLEGEPRIGVVFTFTPLDWTISITESRDRFLADIWRSIRVHAIILFIAIIVVSFYIAIYVRHIISPVERLAGAIETIAVTHNLSHRAIVEHNDEIGFIADRFNNMMSALQLYQEQIKRTGLAEVRARQKAIQGEIETLHLLGHLSDFRDEETGVHQERISSLTKLFSRLLGHDAARQDLIMNATRLHDIGKIAIPDNILRKPGSLTEGELEIIKTHTVRGYELLKDSQSEILAEGAIIAYTHHERWDGTGYPRGLSGDAIPLSGRIVSIVDVFDALTSERPYKARWTNEEALAYIIDKRGTQFDPALVDIFSHNFDQFTDALSSLRE